VFSRIQLLISLVPIRVEAHAVPKTNVKAMSQKFFFRGVRAGEIASVKAIGV
jgi:hypothetical protein